MAGLLTLEKSSDVFLNAQWIPSAWQWVNLVLVSPLQVADQIAAWLLSKGCADTPDRPNIHSEHS